MDVYGGFAMVDLSSGRESGAWLAGFASKMRRSTSRLSILSCQAVFPRSLSLMNRDPLPGVNLTYALTSRQNLRLGLWTNAFPA